MDTNFKIKKVKATRKENMRIGEWFDRQGQGFSIMTERGFVAVDTLEELEEEFNILLRK